MECGLLALVERLLRTRGIRLRRWGVVSLTLERRVASLALLFLLVNNKFLLLLHFRAYRLLEERADPFGACAVVHLAFLVLAGLRKDFGARCHFACLLIAFTFS